MTSQIHLADLHTSCYNCQLEIVIRYMHCIRVVDKMLM